MECAEVGPRVRHTRDRILECAADLFIARGFHDTSVDAVAKAIGGSRATVYQYFESKQAILDELAAACTPAVVDHAHRLTGLGPGKRGMRELHSWLVEWVALRNEYALAFRRFPGVGTGEEHSAPPPDAADVACTAIIADELRAAGVRGMDPKDAAAVIVRITHMLNLRQFRDMLGVGDDARITHTLAVALQRLLYPRPALKCNTITRDEPAQSRTARHDTAAVASADWESPDADNVSPVGQDILSAASSSFFVHGFYA